MESRLFYFPAHETGVGVMPSFYDMVPVDSIADAIEMGGIDVNDSIEDSAAYGRQLAYEHELSL